MVVIVFVRVVDVLVAVVTVVVLDVAVVVVEVVVVVDVCVVVDDVVVVVAVVVVEVVVEPTGGWSSELNVKRFIIYNIIGDVLGVSLVFKKTTSLCCSKMGAACPQSIPSVSVVHSRQLPPGSLTRARNTLTSSFLGQLDQRHFGIQV